MHRLIAPLLAMLLTAAAPAEAQRTAEPQIWFNPHGPALDLLSMWTPSAPWQQAAGKVKVLSLVHWWILKQTDATLLQIFEFARQNHMQLDLSTEPIATLPGDTCGTEEGYMSIPSIQLDIQTLTRLGAKLDWVDMDEPVSFGSYSPGPNGCQYSIPDLVKRVAMIMQPLVAAFPDVQVMEIEPIPTLTLTSTWRQDETAFHIGLAQQLGRPVRSIMLDVQWQIPGWQQDMLDVHSYARRQNMGFNVIYDGNAISTSDAQWINSAVANIESVEGRLQIIPDQVTFTSWDAYPLYNMPETSPTALTWLIDRYVRPRSSLTVQFVGRGAKGKLTTTDGKPIAGATVNGFKPGVDFIKPLPITVYQGVVPATAVTALIGVRINAECNCNGTNDLLLGTVTYQETQGGSRQGSYGFTTTPGTQNGAVLGGEFVGGTMVSRIIARPGQSLTLNGPAQFPVTAGAQYQFNIPAATIGGDGWFGDVILIFVDAHGNGTRVTVVPSPGKALVSTAVTNPDGTFNLFPLPRSVDGPNPVTVEFDGGGGAYRSSVWTPLQ